MLYCWMIKASRKQIHPELSIWFQWFQLQGLSIVSIPEAPGPTADLCILNITPQPPITAIRTTFQKLHSRCRSRHESRLECLLRRWESASALVRNPILPLMFDSTISTEMQHCHYQTRTRLSCVCTCFLSHLMVGVMNRILYHSMSNYISQSSFIAQYSYFSWKFNKKLFIYIK